MRGKMYRARTPVYRACDREGVRKSGSRASVVPRRYALRYIGKVNETAQCVRCLPTSHVARLPLPCVPARFVRFISRVEVPKFLFAN